MNKRVLANVIAVVLIIVVLFTFYMFMFANTKNNDGKNRLFVHSSYDSYTLQAMQWREGRIKLDKDYPWLELAIYKGDYYVSFPPTPTVPMYFLTFIFGRLTPSNAVVMIYNVLSFIFAYLLCRRMDVSVFASIVGAAFSCIASACLFLSMSGGVWFMAQIMAIFLTFAAMYFMMLDNKVCWHLGMFLLALSVGCRPFQIVYFVFFIYLLFKRYEFKILRTWKYFLSPGIVAITYMVYNYVRFDSIFEFGHNYLPEFTRDYPGNYGKFNLRYVKSNFNVFFKDHPKLTENGLEYSEFGFTFYVSNVIFILLAVAVIWFVIKCLKDFEPTNAVEVVMLFVLVCIHLFLMLMHRTTGAWQFGARYMADIIPGALLCILYCKNVLHKRPSPPVLALLAFGTALNIFGALEMYL